MLPPQPSPVGFEHLPDGLGIGVASPRLTWTLLAGIGRQVSYELELERRGGIRRTGRVDSAEQVLVPWPGAPLTSRERATVRVRVWTPDAADPSEWSTPCDRCAVE
ncbi:hypothetical protein ACF1AU_10040 [Streptomyces rubrogriseus]|uniref:glycoside hydrolase family 78 protein n=1 Tax=Streptomyces rubrogriseus TaxID=194673 RepID=UPI00370249D4